MIQPPPGVRATAEPVRGFAEQTSNSSSTFDSVLNAERGAAGLHRNADAALRPRKNRDRSNPIGEPTQPPTSHDVVRQELFSQAPVKATTAAAMEEATSESSSEQQRSSGRRPMAPDPRPTPTAAATPETASASGQQRGQFPVPAEPVTDSPDARTGRVRSAPERSVEPWVQRVQGQPVPSSNGPASAAHPAAMAGAARAQAQPLTAAARPLAGQYVKQGHTRPVQVPPRAPQPQEQPEAQFARGLAAALRQGGGTVTLHLKPEQLGDLKIRLQFHKGAVDARFEAHTDEARALLDRSIDSLRAALEAKGLDVERLSVLLAERKEQHEAQDAPPRDAGDRHGGHGRGPANRHAARTPHDAESTEVLHLPAALTELNASLGGAARLDAIA